MTTVIKKLNLEGLRTGIFLFVKSPYIHIAIIVLTGIALRLQRLGHQDNIYYTAAVKSMTYNFHNFIYGSFDPIGLVSVDKPPMSFWIQAISGSVFGVNDWSVIIPQIIMGILTIIILYLAVRSTFGRLAGTISALTLAVLPVSVLIDSRNEPDGLVSFILILAAVCIIKGTTSGKWKWFILFGLLMGIGFNTKMWVAFIPIPAFLLYYILASRLSWHANLKRVCVTVLLTMIFSFSWVLFVALTPETHRPYVGSTLDNSPWSLTFQYNGLNRVEGFGGNPRLIPQFQIQNPRNGTINRVPSNTQSVPYPNTGPPLVEKDGSISGMNKDSIRRNDSQILISPGKTLTPIRARQTAKCASTIGNRTDSNITPPITVLSPCNSDLSQTVELVRNKGGIVNLFKPPLANQLGWLLPTSLLILTLIILALIPKKIYYNTNHFVAHLRQNDIASQGLLWSSWLITSIVVFGMAKATKTHPYYLVGTALPMSAVLGIGTFHVIRRVKQGGIWAFIGISMLPVGLLFQVVSVDNSIPDWVITIPIATAIIGILISLNGVGLKLNQRPLTIAGSVMVGVSLSMLPLYLSLSHGVSDTNFPRVPIAKAQTPQSNQTRHMDRLDEYNLVSKFIDKSKQNFHPQSILATMKASDAAPFIINDMLAVAIGGFSGRDPVLTVDSFRQLSKETELKYFFLTTQDRIRLTATAHKREDDIIKYILHNWMDVSYAAGLKPHTLFMNPD